MLFSLVIVPSQTELKGGILRRHPIPVPSPSRSPLLLLSRAQDILISSIEDITEDLESHKHFTLGFKMVRCPSLPLGRLPPQAHPFTVPSKLVSDAYFEAANFSSGEVLATKILPLVLAPRRMFSFKRLTVEQKGAMTNKTMQGSSNAVLRRLAARRAANSAPTSPTGSRRTSSPQVQVTASSPVPKESKRANPKMTKHMRASSASSAKNSANDILALLAQSRRPVSDEESVSDDSEEVLPSKSRKNSGSNASGESVKSERLLRKKSTRNTLTSQSAHTSRLPSRETSPRSKVTQRSESEQDVPGESATSSPARSPRHKKVQKKVSTRSLDRNTSGSSVDSRDSNNSPTTSSYSSSHKRRNHKRRSSESSSTKRRQILGFTGNSGTKSSNSVIRRMSEKRLKSTVSTGSISEETESTAVTDSDTSSTASLSSVRRTCVYFCRVNSVWRNRFVSYVRVC